MTFKMITPGADDGCMDESATGSDDAWLRRGNPRGHCVATSALFGRGVGQGVSVISQGPK